MTDLERLDRMQKRIDENESQIDALRTRLSWLIGVLVGSGVLGAGAVSTYSPLFGG